MDMDSSPLTRRQLLTAIGAGTVAAVALGGVRWYTGTDNLATPDIDVRFEGDEESGEMKVSIRRVRKTDTDYLVFAEEGLPEGYGGDAVLFLSDVEVSGWLSDEPDETLVFDLSGESGSVQVICGRGGRPKTRKVDPPRGPELGVVEGEFPEEALLATVGLAEYDFTDESQG